MKILFYIDHITVRGTTNALFAYAYHNEKLLGNTSQIIMDYTNLSRCESIALQYYPKVMPITIYSSEETLQRLCDGADAIYYIKYGKNDVKLPKNIKTLVHCVFNMTEPHGDVYAGVSKSLASKFGSNLYVPHMIDVDFVPQTGSLREQLRITPASLVFGRYGGNDTFDLQFVAEAMVELVTTNPNIYFIFAGTTKFFDHPQLIFCSAFIEPEIKRLFINTCDAYIEAGTMGHSFGLAMGEFSVYNKPVIAYRPGKSDKPLLNTAHLDILGDKGLYFKDKDEFTATILQFSVKENEDYNCYKEYTPEKVMEQFRNVFLTWTIKLVNLKETTHKTKCLLLLEPQD